MKNKMSFVRVQSSVAGTPHSALRTPHSALLAVTVDRIGSHRDLNALVIDLFDRAESQLEAGLSGPFAGVPLVLKDACQEVAGTAHWLGTAVLHQERHVSRYTTRLAGQLERLGFVIVGKGNVPELAASSTTEPAEFVLVRTAADFAAVWAALGPDPNPIPPSLPKLRVGLLLHDPLLNLEIDPACASAVADAGRALTTLGHHIDEAHPAALDGFMAAVFPWWSSAWPARRSSNLDRATHRAAAQSWRSQSRTGGTDRHFTVGSVAPDRP